MPIITFNNKEYYAKDGELLLDCLLRHGVDLDVEDACEDGKCLRCKVRDVSGAQADRLRSTLPEEQQHKGYVLPCTTMVWDSMAVADAAPGEPAAIIEPAALGSRA